MSEKVIIDGVDVSGCEQLFKLAKRKCALLDQVYCEDNPDCYYKQLKRLQKTLKHVENGRNTKAKKLKRIEEIVTHCIQGGFTDEFVQEIFDICREYEDV